MAPGLKDATHQQTWFHTCTAIALVSCIVVSIIEMRVRPAVPGFNEAMDEAMRTLSCEGRPVQARFTGIKPVDAFVQILVIAFMPGTVGMDMGFKVQQAYFLVSFFPVLTIWCVESGRKGNGASWIRFPGIYSIFYQTIGGAIIVPVYYLAYMRNAARTPDYFSSDSMRIAPTFAKALLPSVLFGFLLPTILLPLPIWSESAWQKMIALWQPSPLYVSLLLYVFTGLFSTSHSNTKEGDIKYVKATYAICFVVSVLAHIGTIAYSLVSDHPEVSLGTVFDPRVKYSGATLVAGLKYIFQVDFIGIFGSSLIWAYLAIYDVKRAGRGRAGMMQALMCLFGGSVLLGPAAVLSATWYWRENVFAKIKKL